MQGNTSGGTRLSPTAIILILLFAALVLPPAYFLIKTSLYTTNIDGSFGAFTLQYYSDLAGSSHLASDLWNSTRFACGSAILAILIGATQAWLVERTDTPLRQYVFLISVISLGLPHVLYSSAWLLVLGKSGPVNAMLMGMTGASEPLINVYSMGGMIAIEGMLWSPLAFLLLSPIFRSTDGSFEEAAMMAGAGTSTVLRRITLPLAVPALLALLLLIFVRAFEAFDIPALVGGAGDVYVMTTEIYNSIRKELPANYGQAASFSLTLMLIVVVLLFAQHRLLRFSERFQTITGKGYRPRIVGLGKYRQLAGGFLVLCFLVLLVMPAGMIVLISLLPFYDGINANALRNLSLEHYATVLGSEDFRKAALNTVIFGVSAATCVCILTAGAAWIAARKQSGGAILDQLATAPLIFPAIVLGVAFLQLFLNLPVPLYGTLISLIIAATVQYLPYGMRFNYAGAMQIHGELEEAAASAGASRITTFRRVVLPLLMPVMITSWLFVLLLSVRAVAMPILLAGPNSQLVSVVLFDLWINGQVAELAAFGVLWSGFMMSIGVVFYAVSKRYSVGVQS